MNAMLSPIVAAVEYGGDWELPPIGHLFNFPPIPGTENWGPFAVNRVALMLLFSAVALIAFFWVATTGAKVVPGRLQAAVESLIDFIRERVAIEIIGPEGTRFVPLLTGLFVFIFLNNLFKLTPGIMLPSTSRIAIPLFLAAISWLVFVGVGMKEQGAVTYFKELAFPPGVPKALYVILTPIEILSNLVLRPFTLMVRLFANMVAGHILVVVTLITIHAFLAFPPFGSWAGLPIGVLALFVSPIVFGFELFIITLQAYIFTMLTAVYISSSVHPAH